MFTFCKISKAVTSADVKLAMFSGFMVVSASLIVLLFSPFAWNAKMTNDKRNDLIKSI